MTPDTENGWIEWAPGAMPVPAQALVDVRHSDGTVSTRVEAGDCLYLDGDYGYDWWAHVDCLTIGKNGFITAYRVVQS